MKETLERRESDQQLLAGYFRDDPWIAVCLFGLVPLVAVGMALRGVDLWTVALICVPIEAFIVRTAIRRARYLHTGEED